MIKVISLEIEAATDYDQIEKTIADLLTDQCHPPDIYVKGNLIGELKERLSTKIKRIIFEYPYLDFDFSSTFSGFHSKKFKTLPKECIRMHFFRENNIDASSYAGFMVLRPSYIDSRGRSHFDPKLLLGTDKAFVMKKNFQSHIGGMEYNKESFPWMAQETDIAVCAHNSIWSTLRYLSQSVKSYRDFSMNDVVRLTPHFFQRKVPSSGLNIHQISETFSNAGFYPLILRKGTDPLGFYHSIFSYVDSGIPIIGFMTDKEHAVTIIGHGDIDPGLLDTAMKDIIYSSEVIPNLIICDDNQLPYTKISRDGNGSRYSFNDLHYVIVPLHEKMFLPADIVKRRIEDSIVVKTLEWPSPSVVRIYMASSNKIKSHANAALMNEDLRCIICNLPMPRYVWCADISSKANYQDGLITSRIIADVTAGTKEREPWILIHDSKKVVFYNPSKTNHNNGEQQDKQKDWGERDLDIAPYSLYNLNLKEVEI